MRLEDKEQVDELVRELANARRGLGELREQRPYTPTVSKQYVVSFGAYSQVTVHDGSAPLADVVKLAERRVRSILDMLGALGVDVSGETV